jgi:hypothetical protein
MRVVSVTPDVPANPTISECTFFGNAASDAGGGIAAYNVAEPTIENTIISFSTDGEAVYCTSTPALVCCDMFGNEGGDWVGCIADQFDVNDNFSEDPLFCNPNAGDFSIGANSPCAPENNPACGLVGALPVGCDEPTAVEMTTWGRIKAQHR